MTETHRKRISRARKAWWKKKKKEDPSFAAKQVAILNRGMRGTNRDKAEKWRPPNAIRIELRDQQHWYVFLCEECRINEVWRPCYYFFDPKKYAKRIDQIRCRRCANKHNWDKAREPFESLYNVLKTRRDDTSLTFEEFLAFIKIEACHYCDQQVVWTSRGTPRPTNLDRKDSSVGYTRENCVVCCPECNRIKSDKYSYEEMLVIGKLLKKLRKARWDL